MYIHTHIRVYIIWDEHRVEWDFEFSIKRVISHMRESCLIYEWIMSHMTAPRHTWRSLVTHGSDIGANSLCNWVMSRISESRYKKSSHVCARVRAYMCVMNRCEYFHIYSECGVFVLFIMWGCVCHYVTNEWVTFRDKDSSGTRKWVMSHISS